MAKKITRRPKNKHSMRGMIATLSHASVEEELESSKSVHTSIRFKHQGLAELRSRLLEDLSREYFAVLLAKEHNIGDLRILTVLDVRYPSPNDYNRQTCAALEVDFNSFMRGVLIEVNERVDVDTVIDVHTHPFSKNSAWFSSIDDADESGFAAYLYERGFKYASIVFSQTTYQARYWSVNEKGLPRHSPATVKTQTALEAICSPDDVADVDDPGAMFDRGVRALGLDSMRRITAAQAITVVGVGGLGSVIAEHLVHMGFSRIKLVDFDALEVTNMNRIVGATMEDAKAGRLKVDAVRDHLLAISPSADIESIAASVFDDAAEQAIADSDWVLIATDNHASRFHVQSLCFTYFVPFVSAGVNISVEDGCVTDMSGEVILVRMGDHVCLSCLGRVDYDEIAKETHPDPTVREGLVAKGYVRGAEIKEPAVKTLNTHLATMAVDTLVNQYTGRRCDVPILVYEDNDLPAIYEDRESVERRNLNCSVCHI